MREMTTTKTLMPLQLLTQSRLHTRRPTPRDARKWTVRCPSSSNTSSTTTSSGPGRPASYGRPWREARRSASCRRVPANRSATRWRVCCSPASVSSSALSSRSSKTRSSIRTSSGSTAWGASRAKWTAPARTSCSTPLARASTSSSGSHQRGSKPSISGSGSASSPPEGISAMPSSTRFIASPSGGTTLGFPT